MALINSPYNYLLYYAFICAAIPWFYSYYNDQHRLATMGVETAITKAWDRIISIPTINFQKIVVGINCNVDVIMQGVNVMNKINVTGIERIEDHEELSSLSDLYSTFLHFFSKGAPAERFMANEDAFKILTKLAESKDEKVHHSIGGNAAIMAQKMAASFPTTTVTLVGPIGPRSHALLHPSVVRNNSTRIVQDELHMIYEYKQGEIIGEFVAPASSRFITSHDQFSGSSIVIEMFFKVIAQVKPDLVVLSGIHLLQFQSKEMRLEKLRLLKRSLLQVNPLLPIHLQMASMSDPTFANEVLYRIIPYVDSIALNEQELTFLSKIGNGPYNEQYPVRSGALHVHKVVEMLYWLLSTFGHNRASPDSPNYNYRLQRIHFHCLTYHIVVSKGTDWSNLAAGLAAGAKIAGKQSCNLQHSRGESDLLEIRTSSRTLLDKHQDKVYEFDPHNPIASWMRNEIVFIYTPVLMMQRWSRILPSTSNFQQARFLRKRITVTDQPVIKKLKEPGADYLKDATTYSDVQSALLDPHSSLPYPPEQLENYLDNAQKVVKKSKYKGRKASALNFDHIPIEEQVVALFPGQGSQHLKMGGKVIDCPKSKELFDKSSEILGYDLFKICMEGPKTKLDQTIYCQPAIFVASLAAFEKLKTEREGLEDKLTDTAGFSVGEYAAMVAAGVLSFEDALKIVKIRAEAMHECNQRVASGMVTVKVNANSKLDEAMGEAREVSDEANELPLCEVANYLFCGLKVVGGSNKALAHLESNAQRFNIQIVKKLEVSGAFHTRLMEPAVDIVKEALKGVKMNPSSCNVYSNYTGKIYGRKGSEIKRGLYMQIAAPVKWEQIQQLLYRKHKEYNFPQYIEIGPGRQLGAMLVNVSKKAFKNYSSYPC